MSNSKKKQNTPETPIIKENKFLKFFPLLAIVVLAISCYLTYHQTTKFGFTSFDDTDIIIEKSSYLETNDYSIAFKKDAFFRDNPSPFYRPLQNVSFMYDYSHSGKEASHYHQTNVFLHFLTCVFVFLLLIQLKIRNDFALLIALFYSVNPLFVSAVSWVPSRGDLFIGLFCCTSFWSFLKFDATKNYLYLLISISCYGLAVFSKETGLLLPLLVLVYLFITKRNEIFKIGNIIFFISSSILGGIYFNYRNALISSTTKAISSGDKFGIDVFISNIPTFFEYIFKFIIPTHYSVNPSYTGFITIIGILLFLLLVFSFFYLKKYNLPLVIFCFSWYSFFVAPGMFFQHGISDYSYKYLEHRSYLPIIGLVIMIIGIYWNYIEKLSSKVIYPLGAIIIIFYGSKAHSNSFNYKDPIAYYESAIKSNPKNAMALSNLGTWYKDANDLAKAVYYINESLRYNPKDYISIYHIGQINNIQGKPQDALLMFKKALVVNPNFAHAYNDLGYTYNMLKEHKLAIEALNKCIELDHNFKGAFINLGNAYYNLNDFNKALENYNKVITNDPKAADAYKNAGMAYGMIGDKTKQIEYLKKSASLGEPQVQKWLKENGYSY